MTENLKENGQFSVFEVVKGLRYQKEGRREISVVRIRKTKKDENIPGE